MNRKLIFVGFKWGPYSTHWRLTESCVGLYGRRELDGPWLNYILVLMFIAVVKNIWFIVPESDEGLLEIFFDKGELNENELRSGLHQALKTNGLIPVFCHLRGRPKIMKKGPFYYLLLILLAPLVSKGV